MRLYLRILAALLFSINNCWAQLPDGFKTEDISKRVCDLKVDSINLSSPLEYYLSRTWVRSTGQKRYWKDISSSKFSFDPAEQDEIVDDQFRNYILNETIDRIITYRDSVGAIITHTDGEDLYLLNFCWLENGRWVNGGQGLGESLEEAQQSLLAHLPAHYANLPRITLINTIPQQTPFTDFIRDIESSPEQFVSDMLSTHKLVINGEIHRRKVSWDMLKRLIALPEFPERTGHVFMELPSWCQSMMDQFMEGDTLDTDIILRIFREEQLNGWWDRGEYEFLCDLWQLNHALPAESKIKVTLADYQIPYSQVSHKGQREEEDRNTHMADIIEQTISSTTDKRNSLFLVGCAHAYKSSNPGIASAAYGKKPELTAAAQLAQRLGGENVFTIFQHILSGDNSGNNKRPLREGVFDKAFDMNHNKPIGFKLAGSPFGQEPFDGIYEIKYDISTGSYADNFDGYLFLHPIATEPTATPLTEIFTDEFVKEMQRRASVMGLENIRGIWFGRTAPEMTRDHIVTTLAEE